MRVHLKNPAWMERFVLKIENRYSEESARDRAYEAQRKRLEEQRKADEAVKAEKEAVDRILDSLSDGAKRELEEEVRGGLTGPKSFASDFLIRVKVRILVKERYLDGGRDEQKEL